MRAIVITRPGGPEVLAVEERPIPSPAPCEVQVRVCTAGINRADLMQRLGRYPAPPEAPQDVPGLEFSGVVERCGAEVTLHAPGHRVFGIVGGGAQAEFVCLHESLAMRVPEDLTEPDAGAVPEAFVTAHDALFTQGRLERGERVLVHAVGSGVGLAAVQLAAVHGCETFGTARSAHKLARAAGLGLQHGLAPDGFVEAVRAATQGRGVDVLVDFVGRDYLQANLEVLAPRGRLVLVGLLSGAEASIDLGLVLRKRLTVVGTVLRSRPFEEKLGVIERFVRDVIPGLRAGLYRANVDRVFPFAQVADAHRAMAASENFGKLLLVP